MGHAATHIKAAISAPAPPPRPAALPPRHVCFSDCRQLALPRGAAAENGWRGGAGRVAGSGAGRGAGQSKTVELVSGPAGWSSQGIYSP